MATIYRARDAQLDRDVAVKLLRPEFGQDPDFLSRFRDEARAAASLSHPNIVPVFDFGEDAVRPVHRHGAGRRPGPRLDPPRERAAPAAPGRPRRPRRSRRPSTPRTSAGIVHRDVKPSNILVGRDGRIRVADFGIARALSEAQVTLPGTTMGSVHYFSPEQARGETATAASDIYALGIVLFEALTGAAAVLGRRRRGHRASPGSPPRRRGRRRSAPACRRRWTRSSSARWPSTRQPATPPPPPWPARSRAGSPTRRRPAAGVVAGRRAPAAAAGARRRVAATVAAAAAARPTRSRTRPTPTPARRRPPPCPTQRRPAAAPDRPTATRRSPTSYGPWAWIAGLLGIAILLVVGFLVFRMLTGGGGEEPDAVRRARRRRSPRSSSRRSPTCCIADAEVAGRGAGPDARPRRHRGEHRRRAGHGPVAEPARGGDGAGRAPRSELIVARGQTAVTVPDLRDITEAEALQLIVAEGLTVGTRTDGVRRRDRRPATSSRSSRGPGSSWRPATPDRLRHLRRPRAHPDADRRRRRRRPPRRRPPHPDRPPDARRRRRGRRTSATTRA